MSDNKYFNDLDLAEQEAKKLLVAATEKRIELEKKRIADEASAALARKIELEKRVREIEEEQARKAQAHEIARQKAREEQELALRKERMEEEKRASEAERIRMIEAERAKKRQEIEKIKQAFLEAEFEMKRSVAMAARKAEQMFVPEPKAPTHPLARFLNHGPEQEEPAYRTSASTPAPVPVTKKPDLKYTSADIAKVLAEFPSGNSPTQYDVAEVLKEFSAETIIPAIKSLVNGWMRHGTLAGYQIDQLLTRLRNS
jgi:hypothetical protein